jgi:hypothetical protein
MYYTAYFPSPSTDLRQREPSASVPFLYQVECCTRSHFFTSSVTSLSLSNVSPRMTSLGAPRRWKSEAAISGLQGGWGRTAHQKFLKSFLCFRPCVWSCVVLLKEDCNNIVRGRNLLQSFCKMYEFDCTDLSSWYGHMAHTPKLLLMYSKNSDYDVPC